MQPGSIIGGRPLELERSLRSSEGRIGVRRQVVWAWSAGHLAERHRKQLHAFRGWLIFAWSASPLVLICLPPSHSHSHNPVWTTARIIGFGLGCIPAGFLAACLIALTLGILIVEPCKWLKKHPPIRIIEDSPDLREVGKL